MSVANRIILLVAALLPTFMVVAVSFLFGASLQLIFAALSAMAISLVVTWIATIGPRRHQNALDIVTEALKQDIEDKKHLVDSWGGADPPNGTMSAITIELCRRLVERRQQLKQTMLMVTNALASLTNPSPNSQPIVLDAPPSPDADDGRTLCSTYHIHMRNFHQIRLRDTAQTTLLKDMPLAVLATDLELRVHYANHAAEQLFGMHAARLQKITLLKLFVDPPQKLLGKDVTLPHGLTSKVFYQRLLENDLKDLVVWVRNAHGTLIPTSVAVKLGQHHVFQFLPLASPIAEPKEKAALEKQPA